MEAMKDFVQFAAVSQCQRLWEEANDVVLLKLLADMNMKISLRRTIVATGVIAVVHADLNRIRVRAYSAKEVVRRISFMKSRFLDFQSFISLPKILYNDVTNIVTAGHAYHMNVDTAKVSFRLFKFNVFISLRKYVGFHDWRYLSPLM